MLMTFDTVPFALANKVPEAPIVTVPLERLLPLEPPALIESTPALIVVPPL